MTHRKIILYTLLCLFVLSCKIENKNQINSLLPISNKLKHIKQKEEIMTTINFYEVSGRIKEDSLKYYPINILDSKDLKKWHKVSKQELKDLEIFFRDEPIDKNISLNIMRNVKRNKCFVSYIYNFNSSAPTLKKGYAHRDRQAIPGEKGYLSGSWIDMYFLNIQSKEIIHISYGKF